MLKHLLIKNYALIEHLEMEPSHELNIITGETGAGKSIMLGAIGLLLGKRADIKTLYHEDEKCIIEGTFDISSYHLESLFHEEDLDYEQLTLLRREISPGGKSRAFINDTPVNLEVMKKVGSFLMDIHSQHDTLQLGSNTFQLSLIDSYAQNGNLLHEYQQSFNVYLKADKKYKQMLSEADDIKKEADYNQFLYDELASVQLVQGEQEELENDLKKLENAEEIKLRLNEAIHLLSLGENSINSGLYAAKNALNQISSFSASFSSLKERLDSCLIELKDINDELENEESLVSYDGERIEFISERLNSIYKLQQKHRVETLEALIEIQNELGNKVQKILNLDDEIEDLRLEVEEKKGLMLQNGLVLRKSRKEVSEKLSNQVQKHLQELGMPDAVLQIVFKEAEPFINGIDQVEILFSANKGIRPQDLKSVASGGEFSRLMFCIKYILADKTALPTIVFDEIDTGISGAIAMKMVNMMKKMAKAHQVISISHLPQIAAKGDAHYFVYKDNSADKTLSRMKLLSEEERITAIAMMIGGDNPSPVAYESAKELMAVN